LFGGSIGLAKQQEEHRLFGDAGDRLYMKKNDDSAFLFGRNSEQATTNSNSNSNSNNLDYGNLDQQWGYLGGRR
jgi:hypothetical protein